MSEHITIPKKFLTHTLPTICLLTALSLLAACSDKHVSKEDMEHVRSTGRQRALELANSSELDTIEIEKRLIDIRERERRLRSNGYPNAADAYIESFMATLDSVNPALAAELR